MGSPSFPLVVAGTLTVHALLVLVIDVATVVGKEPPRRPAPRIGLVDIDVKKLTPVQPEPTPPPEPAPPEEVVAPPTTTPPPSTPRARTRTATRPQTSNEPPVETPVAPEAAGGSDGPVVPLQGLAPVAKGVPAGVGKRGRGGTGGGQGTGTGEGDGAGSGSGPAPLSVAAIKTPAKPKGDFDYLALGKDYPAEAKRLGVEGELRARLVVDATGKVTSVRLLGSLGHGLDELALNQARKLQFEPARDANDQPVPSVVVWTFTFTLPS